MVERVHCKHGVKGLPNEPPENPENYFCAKGLTSLLASWFGIAASAFDVVVAVVPVAPVAVTLFS